MPGLRAQTKTNTWFYADINITMLAYYEETPDVREAITREKQIKGWLRSKKIALIESLNPNWEDLSAELFEQVPSGDIDPG